MKAEKVCKRCGRVQKAVAGLAVGCCALVAAPATSVAPVTTQHAGSAFSAQAASDQDGPHNPGEGEFLRAAVAKSGANGSGDRSPALEGFGAAVEAFQVVRN